MPSEMWTARFFYFECCFHTLPYFSETHHEAVQYGQYYAKKDWREQTKDNPMVMTSMMLYLKRMTDMDKEVAEYSQTQVILTHKKFLVSH